MGKDYYSVLGVRCVRMYTCMYVYVWIEGIRQGRDRHPHTDLGPHAHACVAIAPKCYQSTPAGLASDLPMWWGDGFMEGDADPGIPPL